jgi:DNA-binding response OmpR family regulator
LNETNDPSASEKPRIWTVDADHWPRAYLRAELIERGYEATGFETLKDAVIRLLVARARRPALLVIDLHGQVIDDKLGSVLLRERLPVIAVADATSSEILPRGALVELLRRPLTIGAVADAVDRFMRQNAHDGPPGPR